MILPEQITVKGDLNMSQNLTYTMQGDYLIPDLIPPEFPKLGKYGMLRRNYLKQWRIGLYTGMLLSNKLNSHLEEIDLQANTMIEQLTKQYAQEAGATESLKAQNQMQWVQLMTNCHNRAEETVLKDLIYS